MFHTCFSRDRQRWVGCSTPCNITQRADLISFLSMLIATSRDNSFQHQSLELCGIGFRIITPAPCHYYHTSTKVWNLTLICRISAPMVPIALSSAQLWMSPSFNMSNVSTNKKRKSALLGYLLLLQRDTLTGQGTDFALFHAIVMNNRHSLTPSRRKRVLVKQLNCSKSLSVTLVLGN